MVKDYSALGLAVDAGAAAAAAAGRRDGSDRGSGSSLLSSPQSPSHLLQPAHLPPGKQFWPSGSSPGHDRRVEVRQGGVGGAATRHSPGMGRVRASHSADRAKDRLLSHSSDLSTRSSPGPRNGAGSKGKMGSRSADQGRGAGEQQQQQQQESLYQRLAWQQQYDEGVQRDLTLGRRVGFYKFKSELGTGNFSKVKLAQHLLTKERVAVKMIDKTKLDAKTQKMVLREINIMDSLSHPSLIRLYEVCETLTALHLVMEYAPGGELFAKLTEEGPYGEDDARTVFAQIASAVEYMHDNYFIHRDLKAENVFFASGGWNGGDVGGTPRKRGGSRRGSSSGGSRRSKSRSPPDSAAREAIRVKVGDFGFATQVDKIDQHLNTFCGSPPYAAPELFQDDHYLGPSVDIWALGILLYFLVTGSMPFKGSTVAALKHAILEGRFDLPEELSVDCCEVITGILRRRPEWRLTMEQIRDCSWLSSSSPDWLREDRTYRPQPLTRERIRAGQRMSANEERVREELAELGVEGDALDEHAERGARSQVVGAYRILLHREILGKNDAKGGRSGVLHGVGRSDTPAVVVTSPAVRNSISLGDVRGDGGDDDDGSFVGTPKMMTKRKKKSKFCVIL